MTTPVPTDPQPPVDAYLVVCPLLPARYLTTAPPAHGLDVTFWGADNRPSSWRLGVRDARKLITALETHPLIRRIQWHEYHEHEPAPDRDRRFGS